MSRWIVGVPILTGVYAIALGSAKPADVATGVLVAAATLAIAGPFQSTREAARRPLLSRVVAFPLWLAIVAREVGLGVWQMVRASLAVDDVPSSGVVGIPIDDRSEQGIAVTALAATISPGEVAFELDREGGMLYLHVIDAEDPDAVRERHQRIYERYQRKVFP